MPGAHHGERDIYRVFNELPLNTIAVAREAASSAATGGMVMDDPMSVLRWTALSVVALALGGCCTSGLCTAPSPVGVPIAWDGAGTRPSDDQRPAKRPRRPRNEIVIGPLNAVEPAAVARAGNPADAYAQQQSEAEAAEQELKQHLVICRDCLAH
ncbi:MAG: hypothetical protein AB1586_07800 [Pseudomonadota bacterium]